MMKKIMGIDPGTLTTGFGIIHVTSQGLAAIDYGCIRPPQKMKLSDRYMVIFNCIEELIEKHSPQEIAIETQFVSLNKNPQSAIKVGMARGVVVVAAKRKGISIYEYSPTAAKKAVSGSGASSKHHVGWMIQRLLKLPQVPEPHDAADALSLAICHAHAQHRRQILGTEI